MWLPIAFGIAAILAGGALFNIASAIYSEHVLDRFRRDPASVPMDVVCKHIAREDLSVGLLAGCGGLVGAIIGLPAIFVRHGLDIVGFTAIAGCIGGFLVKVPFDWLFGPRRRPVPIENLPVNGGGRLPYFAAALLPVVGEKSADDPKAGQDKKETDDDDGNSSDCETYKVFIAPTMLCAAETLDDVDETGVFVVPSVIVSSETTVMFYDAFDVTSPDFHRLNEENFQIAWRDITSLSCDPAPKPEKIIDVPNSGSITLHLKSGETRELIVLGKRDIAALQSQLQGRLDDVAGAEEPYGFDASAPTP